MYVVVVRITAMFRWVRMIVGSFITLYRITWYDPYPHRVDSEILQLGEVELYDTRHTRVTNECLWWSILS